MNKNVVTFSQKELKFTVKKCNYGNGVRMQVQVWRAATHAKKSWRLGLYLVNPSQHPVIMGLALSNDLF